jgi:hypothetical protein
MSPAAEAPWGRGRAGVQRRQGGQSKDEELASVGTVRERGEWGEGYGCCPNARVQDSCVTNAADGPAPIRHQSHPNGLDATVLAQELQRCPDRCRGEAPKSRGNGQAQQSRRHPVNMRDGQNWTCECSIMEHEGPRAQEEGREPGLHSPSSHAMHADTNQIHSPPRRAIAQLAAFAAAGLHPKGRGSTASQGKAQLAANLVTKGAQVHGCMSWRHKAELQAAHWSGSSPQCLHLGRQGDKRPACLRHRQAEPRHSRARSRTRRHLLLLPQLLLLPHWHSMRRPSRWARNTLTHLRSHQR